MVIDAVQSGDNLNWTPSVSVIVPTYYTYLSPWRKIK